MKHVVEVPNLNARDLSLALREFSQFLGINVHMYFDTTSLTYKIVLEMPDETKPKV